MNLDSIPDELRQLNQFVCWDLRSGRKIPINAETGSMAKADDPTTWMPFDVCVASYRINRYRGIGFEFSSSDPYCGIDFDHCLDESLAFKDPITRSFFLILWKSGSYCEISQSGNGIHVIVKNSIPEEFLNGNVGGRKFGSFCEMYQSHRYFALTGDLYHSRFKVPKIKSIESRTWIKCLKILQSGDYQQFLELADRRVADLDPVQSLCKSNSKFANALNGDSSYWDGDESDRDIYVLSRLFECLGDRELVREYFMKSGVSSDLSRPEHRGHEQDYLNRSLDFAESRFRQSKTSKTSKVQSPSQVKSPPVNTHSQDSYDCTDLDNGRNLFSICCKNVRYCCKLDQFYRWNYMHSSQVWDQVNYPSLYDICAVLSEDLKIRADQCSDESMKKKYLRGSSMMKMNSSCDRAITRLQSFTDLLVDIEDLDSERLIVPCLNGYLNLETGEFSDPNPDCLFTHNFDVHYNPDATSDRWNSFIEEVLPDVEVRREIQKFMGYCLTGDISHEKFLYIYGHGGNGKGTFLNACQSVLGSFSSSFPLSLLSFNKFKDGESPSPVLANLRSKRLAVSDEISSSISLNVAQLKSLTGGDRIIARGLNQSPFEFIPQFKLIIVGNELACLGSINDAGLNRRVLFAGFDVTPSNPDPNLKRYLSSPVCRSAILNWMIDGYSMLQSEGFIESESMKSGRESLMSVGDVVSSFIAEYCEFDESGTIKVSEFMNRFITVTNSNLSRSEVINRVLSDRRIKLIRPSNIQTFKGVKFHA